MSSFFIKKKKIPAKQKILNDASKNRNLKRKRKVAADKPQDNKHVHKNDEEIDSDSDDFDRGSGTELNNIFHDGSASDEEVSAQDKRLRLAKKYLDEKKQETDADHEKISQQLQSEYLESVGRLRQNIADTIEGYNDQYVVLKHKKHHLSICCLALSTDGNYLFAGAKSKYIIKWNLQKLKADGIIDIQPHTVPNKPDIKKRSYTMALCLSSDMKFLAIADGGNCIQIWCPQELKYLHRFHGHRDTVSALVFRKGTYELFSASHDRSVKLWTLTEMSYIESLFGHQASITSIDCSNKERVITSGGVDCSIRIWKITDESQLIYNATPTAMDNVRFLNDENFISAGSNGSLNIWNSLKKRPSFTITSAHGQQTNGDPNWITALACLTNTDLLATGSCDGYIHIWKSVNGRELQKVTSVPICGFVNHLIFSNDGKKLIAAIGQEHRLGRWWSIKEARNKIIIIDLIRTTTD